MEPEETSLDHQFDELQASFDQAALQVQQRLAARLYHWAEQQLNLPPEQPAEDDGGESPQGSPPAVFPETPPRTVLQDIQRLVERRIGLRQVPENLTQVLWLQDVRSGRILYVSPVFETVWGRSSISLYADPSILIESIHPEDRVQVLAAPPSTDLKPLTQTYRILRPDGSLCWILARTILLRDASGGPDILVCVAQDISDQKKVELTLRKTLDRIREQFELSRRMSLARKPQSVLKILMSARQLSSAKRATLFFFDQPKLGPAFGEELIATWQSSRDLPAWPRESSLYEDSALWELLHPSRIVVISGMESNQRLKPSVREVLREGNIQTMVTFPLVSLGNWIGCLLVYYQHEQLFEPIELRHLKVLVDQATITLYNLKLLVVEAESRHEAERANEIKTEFLAMISHELRTPLTSILGFTSTLLSEDVRWGAEEQRDFIQTIQQEADRLQELIDHLLDLSRLEAGILPMVRETVPLQEIMEDALPQLRTLTNEHKLLVHLPENLPPVYADPKRISQVLVNLTRNSAVYAPQGTEICISANVQKGFVKIIVNDQGPGIPPSEHRRVFKAFQRGTKGENGSVQGAGLGLAICKGLIETHGGRIWIKRKATPGATISFTIPLTPVDQAVNTPVEDR